MMKSACQGARRHDTTTTMKRLGSIALVSLLAVVGCDNTSRLDKTTKAVPKANTPPTEAAPGPIKADHSGTLEERVARLEDNFARYGEALDFLAKVYAQQKQQQQAQEREEPAPDAVFAVDVAPDVKAGQVEGSPQALITIVEAWDFA
jgi:hypothetical protein